MDKEKIGKFIVKLRKKKGISQADLAKEMQKSVKTIEKWEMGKRLPSILDLENLCFILNTTLNELLGGEKSNMVDDDMIFLYKQKQRKKKIFYLSLIVVFCLIVTFVSININKNQKVKIYSINGESEHFYYLNAMFVSSNIKNIYVYGDLESKNEKVKVSDITNISLKSNNRLIISSNSLPKQISVENYGYNELFPKDVVNNLDNWYLEISYKIDDELKTEILKLENRYLMDKVKVQPIS